MICAISKENRGALEDYHIDKLVTLFEQNRPLDLKQYLTDFYQRLLAPRKSGTIRSNEQALSYVHLSPGIIRQILRSDSELENHFVKNGFDLSNLAKLHIAWETTDIPLEAVQQYVGLPQNVISILKQQIETNNIVAQQPGYDPQSYDYSEPEEPEFIAQPLNPKSTTGIETIPGPPGTENILDPEQKVRRMVQRMIIRKVDTADNDSRKIKIKGLYGGVYLTAMSIKKLQKSRPEVTGDPDTIFHVLTGDYNEILLFDQDGNLNDDTGEPMYYSSRKVIQSAGEYIVNPPLAPIEAVIREARDKGINLSREQALRDRQSDLAENFIAAQHIAKDPENNTVQSYITGGSLGYAKFGYEFKSTLSKPYPDPIKIEIQGSEKGPFTSNAAFFMSPDIKVPIQLQKHEMDDDFKTKIISTITDDIRHPADNKPISDPERMALVKQFMSNNPKGGFEIYLDNRKMFLKINGNPIDLTNREETKRILTDYFNSFIKLDVSPEKAEGKKVIDGDKPGFEELIKNYDIVRKKDSTGAVYYQRYVKPSWNISRDHLDSTYFNDYSLTPEGDHFVLNPNITSYYNWLKNHVYINYKLNPEGKLQVLNSYFTYELTDQGRQTLFPEAESKPEVPKTDPGVTAQGSYEDLTPDDTLSEFEKYVKKHGLQKTSDQKFYSISATKKQNEEAKVWYDNHLLSKYFPYKVMFNVVNTKQSGSIASWVISGITLTHGADYSDLYHEAWHGFSQAFLTKEQKKELLTEVRKRSGSFTNHLGKRVTFKKASYLEIEEYLAEDFRKYMLSKGDHILKSSPVRNTLFRKIYNFLRALFGNTTQAQLLIDDHSIDTVRELYEKLKVGNINEYTFSTDNTVFDVLHKGIVSTKEDYPLKSISINDSNIASETIDSIFSDIVKKWNRTHLDQRMTPNMFTTKGGRELAYKYALGKIQKALRNSISEYQQATDLLSKASILRKIELLNYMDDNFGNLKDPGGISSGGKGLIWYHNDKSKFIRLEDKLDEEDKQKSYQLHTTGGNTTSVKDDADPGVMYLLASLHKIDPLKAKRIKELESQSSKTDKEKSELFRLKKEPYLLNRLGFAKPADSTYILRGLSRDLQGSATPAIMYQRLLKLKSKYSFIPELLELLGPEQTTDPNAIIMWSAFFQTFSKIKIDNVNDIIHEKTDKDKKVTYESHVGLAGKDRVPVQRAWDADFQSGQINSDYKSSFIIKKRGDPAYLDLNSLIKDKDHPKGKYEHLTPVNFFEFLNDIGLKMTDNEEIRKRLTNLKFIEPYDRYLMGRLRAMRDNGIVPTTLKELFGKEFTDKKTKRLFKGENKRYNDIADLQATYSEIYSPGSVTDYKGDTIFILSKNNSISAIKKALDEATSWQDVINNPATRFLGEDPSILYTHTYRSLFDEQGNKRQEAEWLLQNIGGSTFLKDDDLIAGASNPSSDPYTKFNQDLDTFIQSGVIENPRAGEKSSSYTTRPNRWVTSFSKDKKIFFGLENFADGLSSSLFAKINTTVLPYLYIEHARVTQMRSALEDKARGVLNKLNDAPDYVKRGSVFNRFDDILSEKTKEDLYAIKEPLENYFKKGSQKSKDLMNQIQKDFRNYFTKYFNQMDYYWQNLGVMSDNILKKINDDPNFRGLSTSNKGLALTRAMGFNVWINNTEYAYWISGDEAMYKPEDYPKRIPMFGSTGIISTVSPSLFNLINQQNDEFSYSKLKKIFPRGTNKPKTFSGNLSVSTLKDSVVKSTAHDIFKEAQLADLSKRFSGKELDDKINSEMKPFLEMKEADSQGLITYDAARALLTTMNLLTPEQKNAYRLSVEAAVNGSNVPVGTEGFMPVLKFQYAGPAVTVNGLTIMSGHKFTLFVLNPYVIKDFPALTKQHHRMMGSGIDYVLFESGSKLVTPTNQGKKDQFYSDDNRTPDTSELTPTTIRIEYLKDQMNLGDKLKGTSIFSTQLRKELPRGIYEGGVPTNILQNIPDLGDRKRAWEKLTEKQKQKSELYRLAEQLRKSVDNLTRQKWDALKVKIGWEGVDYGKLNVKILEVINKQLQRSGLSQHEREYIDLRDIQSELVKFKDLSIHPSQELIEKAVAAMYNNFVIRQKITGESLISIASTGIEDYTLIPKGLSDREMALQYGTNGLRTYLPGPKTKPSESIIPLIGPFIKLLDTYHKDGQLIGLNKNNEAECLKRLNETISDPEWLKQYSHLITYPGVRIPVEDQNFMKFEIVKKFISGLAGPISFHASEDVAITGEDFDGDKRPTYFPNIGVIDGKPFLITATEAETKDMYEQYKKEQAKILRGKLTPIEEYKAYDKLIKGIFQHQTGDIEQELNEEAFQLAEEVKLMSVEEIEEAFHNKEIDANFIEEAINKNFKIKTYEDFRKKYQQDNLVRAAENQLLRSIISILEHPSTYTSLTRANATESSKEMADEMREHVTDYKATMRFSDGAPGTVSPTRLVEYGWNLQKHQDNKIAQDSLGIEAVENYWDPIHNEIGSRMKYSYLDGTANTRKEDMVEKLADAPYPVNKQTNDDGKLVISLSNLYNQSGERISHLSTNRMDLLLEAAKNDDFASIALDKESIPTIQFLSKMGGDVKLYTAMANQPIIREYVKEIKKARYPRSRQMGAAPNRPNFFINKARGVMLKRYAGYAPNINNSDDFNPRKDADTIRAIYNQYRSLVYPETDNVKSNQYRPDAFKLSRLKANVKNKSNIGTPDDLAVLLEWFDKEDMSKPYSAPKFKLNPDTKKSTSAFMLMHKQLEIDQLDESKMMENGVMEYVVENSVISSFFNDNLLDLISPVLPARANRILVNFLFSKIPDFRSREDIEAQFGDIETWANKFFTELNSFIYQNKLRQFDPKDPAGYRNLVSKSSDVKQQDYLKTGAIVKDGILYYDLITMFNQWADKDYTGKPYKDLGLATLSPDTFDTTGEFYHYVFEREYLRSMTKLDDIKVHDPLFTSLRVQIYNQTPEGTTDEQLDKLTYEEYIKTRALENIGNAKQLFQGNHSFASQVIKAIKDHDLSAEDKYPVLNYLVATTSDSRPQLTNLKLTDSRLEADEIDKFHEAFKELADPDIMKVYDLGGNPDVRSNTIISRLFQKMPMVAFLQSGWAANNEFSLIRLVDRFKILNLMDNALQDFLKSLKEGENIRNPLLEDYYRMFIQNNSFYVPNKTRYKNYTLRRRGTGLTAIKGTASGTIRVDKFHPDYFSYHTTNLTSDEIRRIKKTIADYRSQKKLEESERDDLRKLEKRLKDQELNVTKAVETAQVHKDKVFVYDKGPSLSGYFRSATTNNTLGLPQGTDKTLEKNKQLIDEAINNHIILKESGLTPAFSINGHGQDMIGLKEDGTRSVKGKPGLKTFMYLSQKLFEHFNYVNKGYDVQSAPEVEAAVEVLSKNQPVSDQEVRDIIRNCLT